MAGDENGEVRHAKGVNYTLRTLHEGTETLIRPGTEVNIMTASGWRD